jgi:hypothetical protein
MPRIQPTTAAATTGTPQEPFQKARKKRVPRVLIHRPSQPAESLEENQAGGGRIGILEALRLNGIPCKKLF